MRGCSLGPSICWLVTAFAAEASPGGQTPATPVITALLYDEIGVPAAILRDVTQFVSSVYQRAGVTLSWVNCLQRADTQVVNSCGHLLLYGDELIITISRPAKVLPWSVRASALGLATAGDGEADYCASIFYDHIRELAERERVRPSLILGYALAHEIGHLLLRSSSHSPSGVMRTRWDRETRERAERGGLRFLPEEAKRVREEAVGRVESAGRLATRRAETAAGPSK